MLPAGRTAAHPGREDLGHARPPRRGCSPVSSRRWWCSSSRARSPPHTRAQAVEALNSQITLAIAYLAAFISLVVLIGVVLLPLVAIGHVVLGILVSVASGRGELDRYPLTIRMVS